MQCRDEWIYRVLITSGVITEAQVADVRRSEQPFASKELIRRGFATKEQLASADNSDLRTSRRQ